MAKIILLLILAQLLSCLSNTPNQQINHNQNIRNYPLIEQNQLKLDHTQTILILHKQKKSLVVNLLTNDHNQIHHHNFQFAAITLKHIAGDKNIKILISCINALFQLQINEYYYLNQILKQCENKNSIGQQKSSPQKVQTFQIIFQSLGSVQLYQVSYSNLLYPLQIRQNNSQKHNIYFKQYKQPQSQSEDDLGPSIPIKYIQITFNNKQTAVSLKFQRFKGYPTVYFYQCDQQNLQVCKQQIQKGYIQGFILLKRIQTVKLQKDQQNCPNCMWLIGIKTSSQVLQLSFWTFFEHTKTLGDIKKQNINKNLPINEVIMGKLDRNQSQQNYNVFLIRKEFKNNESILQQFCVDITIQNIIMNRNIVQNERKTQHELSQELSKRISFQLSTYKSELQDQAKLEDDFFQMNVYKKMVRITSKERKFFNVQQKQSSIFKIMLTITLPKDFQSLSYLIISHNQKQNYPRLPDGLTIAAYPFRTNNEQQMFQFQVNSNHLGILHITALNCLNFIKIQILSSENDRKQQQKSIQDKNRFKIQPKLFLPVIQNLSFCNQLFQIHPSGINESNKETFLKYKIIFNKINHSNSNLTSQFYITFSRFQPIFLPANFMFSNIVQYNSSNFYLVTEINGQVQIKISKCSQCQISIYYFQQQLMKTSLFGNRKSQANFKIIQKLTQSIRYEMKHGSTLYLEITTNNFAYYNIQVSNQLAKDNFRSQIEDNEKQNNQIVYSLNEDGVLYIKFDYPLFNTRNIDHDITFFLIQGSIKNQVARQTYCPKNIFTMNQRTRDVAITQIKPHRKQGKKSTFQFNLTLKHHDYFGIRANNNDSYYSYEIVDVTNMKQFGTYRWAIFHSALFVTLAVFFAFVCYLALKKKTFKTKGYLSQEYENQEKQHLKQSS